jgi:predicted transcriptional regulator
MELKQGDLENIILNALWFMEEEAGGKIKIDVRDVQEKIKTDTQKWAYTTVKTVLDRLVDKDLVKRVREGKKYLYHTLVSRHKAGEEAIKKLVRQYYRTDYKEMISNAEKIYSATLGQKELSPAKK